MLLYMKYMEQHVYKYIILCVWKCLVAEFKFGLFQKVSQKLVKINKMSSKRKTMHMPRRCKGCPIIVHNGNWKRHVDKDHAGSDPGYDLVRN